MQVEVDMEARWSNRPSLRSQQMHIEFEGPAGRLEGLLDEPTAHAHDPAAPRIRAAVVFAHPHPTQGGTMHTKAVLSGRERSAAHRLRGAAVQLPRRGRELRDFRPRPRRGRGLSSAALDVMTARYPGVPLWAAGFSFGSWIALETGAVDPRVSVLIGIAPPVSRDGYAFPQTLETTKPKFFVQGDLDELCPLKDLMAFYAKLKEPKEHRRHRRREASVRRPDAGSRRRARRSSWRLRVMPDAVIVSAVRTPVGKAPRGVLQRGAAGRARRARPRRSDPPRARPRSGVDRRRDFGVRDAGGGARPQRRAHRQPARRTAGLGVCAHGQPFLRVGPRSNRARG